MVVYKHEYFESKKEIKITEVELEKKFSIYQVVKRGSINCNQMRLTEKDFDVLRIDSVPSMLSFSPSPSLFLSLLLERNKKEIEELEKRLKEKKKSNLFLLLEKEKEKKNNQK